jgi:hypothetical protein
MPAGARRFHPPAVPRIAKSVPQNKVEEVLDTKYDALVRVKVAAIAGNFPSNSVSNLVCVREDPLDSHR